MPYSSSIFSRTGRSSPSRLQISTSCIPRQPQFRTKALDDGPQTGAETQRSFVLDPAILDAQAVEPFAVALRMPTEMQMIAADSDRTRQRRHPPR